MGRAGATSPFFALLSLLTLAGCGSGGGSGGESVAQTIISGGAESVVQIDPAAFEVQPYCPPLDIAPTRYISFNYERGKEDDARALIYQASIEKWARDCRRDAGGQVRAKIGLSGRVTPGPAWKGGEVLLPVRVDLVVAGGEAGAKPVDSKVFTVPVTLGEGAPAELWTLVDDSFVFPAGTDLKMIASIDQGGDKRKRR